jgi:hypothetical protein
MVDTTHIRAIPDQTLVSTIASSLQECLNHQIGSQQLVEIAEDLQWALLEGEHRNDRAPATEELRSLLADITAQWECLLGELHDRGTLIAPAEFPTPWVRHWLAQAQSCLLRKASGDVS